MKVHTVDEPVPDTQRHARPASAPHFDAGGRQVDGGPPPSFPEHVRQRLEDEIIEGVLEPGERVTETGLAARMGISRTPVREAMRLLESRGLIVHRRGRGAYVAHRTTFEEAEILYELRLPIEGHLAASAARRCTGEDVDTLVSLQADFARLTAGEGAADVRAIAALDHDFHWTVYNIADSDLVSIVATYWGRLLREIYGRVYTSAAPQQFAAEHERVIAALAARDPDAARAAMQSHIRSGWSALRESFAREASEPAAP
jgi:DNA-binding GntR family transcriptional regulator